MLAGAATCSSPSVVDTLSTRRRRECGADDDGGRRMADRGAGLGKVRRPPPAPPRRRRREGAPSPQIQKRLSKRAGLVASAVDRAAPAAHEWARLYSGVGASLLLTVNPAIQHTCFEQARRRVIGGLRRRIRRGERRLSGAKKRRRARLREAAPRSCSAPTATAVATFITHPLVRAKLGEGAGTARRLRNREAPRRIWPPPRRALPEVEAPVAGVPDGGGSRLYKGGRRSC